MSRSLVLSRWYLWDYDRGEVVQGPYQTSNAAAAIRDEIEGERNLWVVNGRTIAAWRRELAGHATEAAA